MPDEGYYGGRNDVVIGYFLTSTLAFSHTTSRITNRTELLAERAQTRHLRITAAGFIGGAAVWITKT
jgi:hypothetical protein